MLCVSSPSSPPRSPLHCRSQTQMTHITDCPVCGASSLSDFIKLPNLPIYCNLLWADRQEAKDCPKGDIELAFCDQCGAVVNVVFDPQKLGYSQDYENSLHYSSRFQSYIEDLAERLIEQHDLHGKTIVEIGCGKGDFLALLCEKGNNSGIGFDSSYVDRDEHAALGDRIKFIKDFYSEKYVEYQGDFVCCRQVLEHVQRPADLLDPLRKTLEADQKETNQKTAVFFEVPNALYTIRNMMVWDVIYEHCTYFTPPSLSYAFTLAGYTVKETSEEFGGQFLSIEAQSAGDNQTDIETDALTQPLHKSIAQLAEEIASFKTRFETQTQQWEERLSKLFEQGKRVVIWGSGSKGVTFLNLLTQGSQIEYAVDINPRKQGKFIPGTGQPIVSPDYVADRPADVVIVMNPLYKEEIRDTLAQMGLAPEILTTESA